MTTEYVLGVETSLSTVAPTQVEHEAWSWQFALIMAAIFSALTCSASALIVAFDTSIV